MAAAFEKLVSSGDIWELTAPEDRPGGHAALFIPAKDYINAFRIRVKIQQALDEILIAFRRDCDSDNACRWRSRMTRFPKPTSRLTVARKLEGRAMRPAYPRSAFRTDSANVACQQAFNSSAARFEENKLLAIAKSTSRSPTGT